MSEAEFAAWALKICLGVLIVFLFFIIWDLGKKSQVGKMGMFILFLVLAWALRDFYLKMYWCAC